MRIVSGFLVRFTKIKCVSLCSGFAEIGPITVTSSFSLYSNLFLSTSICTPSPTLVPCGHVANGLVSNLGPLGNGGRRWLECPLTGSGRVGHPYCWVSQWSLGGRPTSGTLSPPVLRPMAFQWSEPVDGALIQQSKFICVSARTNSKVQYCRVHAVVMICNVPAPGSVSRLPPR